MIWVDLCQIGNYIYYMVKNFKRYEFATFSKLEKYFTKKILPQKNKSSKVIGKVLLVWDKKQKTNKEAA